ncbi:MAG: hypothetical protein UT24_C0003G0037 [Candidatus Woesebacteria bacterium GW2011_GWB1_39_12]|uniref:Uncharacterized protein n=1 Tax=Candidatus Woesebacteria bacterium GW2011_GWB1_39_12 TaxID=1618574 RepID=A0A0G0PTX3_9BACT|nr:MAG: hypothetical protein UT24_C0003G0037 [Candidatus Woesebacteria bacterium GW2011_GWB1_39_12]
MSKQEDKLFRLLKGLEQLKTEIMMKSDDLRNEHIDEELVDFRDDHYKAGYLHGLQRARKFLEVA